MICFLLFAETIPCSARKDFTKHVKKDIRQEEAFEVTLVQMTKAKDFRVRVTYEAGQTYFGCPLWRRRSRPKRWWWSHCVSRMKQEWTSWSRVKVTLVAILNCNNMTNYDCVSVKKWSTLSTYKNTYKVQIFFNQNYLKYYKWRIRTLPVAHIYSWRT